MTPYWQLAPPYWELGSRRMERRPLIKPAPTIYRTVVPSPELIERDAAGTSILSMRFALFNTWTEINNPAEGHFMERIQRGAFAKSIRASLRNIRALLSHGKDRSLGETVLGKIESIEEAPDAAIARVELFPSVPALLVDGLKAEQYGASFRGSPIKSHIERRPPRSAHNPLGIPEVTRQEIRLRDIGPTPFAQYEGTTAQIQGVTDALVPERSRPAGQLDLERPYWELRRDPRWQLTNRKDERRGRETFSPLHRRSETRRERLA